ncbi:MAG: vancomycin high temperature exclusion protein [Firmicutes bacterium ADurb.Bin182]|nr:MAG: vancomycin high temperature exclusion protein [Firmicutes bacterium ADurb.Bin182]
MIKNNKKVRMRTVIALVLLLLIVLAPFVINGLMIVSAKPYILSPSEAEGLGADCILVLGARVWSSGTLSAMLEDRVLQGIRLYEAGVSERLLMSGDHGRKNYDEVNHMKQYAVDKGVKPEHVFMDHAGFSTYESMYRARDIFKAEKIVIVTQEFHIYRAVYVARALGIDAYGVPTEPRIYKNEAYNGFREFLARVKDFIMVILGPEPTYLGEAIPISGSGTLTDD